MGDKTVDTAQKGHLAVARRANHCHDIAFTKREIDILEYLQRAILYTEVFDDNALAAHYVIFSCAINDPAPVPFLLALLPSRYNRFSSA